MIEDQEFYAACDAMSVDAEKPNTYGHIWGKPYQDGYAVCHNCGATENTFRAAEMCVDAEKPALSLCNKLWRLFDLGMRAGRYANMRVLSDKARNDAAKIIKELTAPQNERR